MDVKSFLDSLPPMLAGLDIKNSDSLKKLISVTLESLTPGRHGSTLQKRIKRAKYFLVHLTPMLAGLDIA